MLCMLTTEIFSQKWVLLQTGNETNRGRNARLYSRCEMPAKYGLMHTPVACSKSQRERERENKVLFVKLVKLSGKLLKFKTKYSSAQQNIN